jgi:hypothetical protein
MPKINVRGRPTVTDQTQHTKTRERWSSDPASPPSSNETATGTDAPRPTTTPPQRPAADTHKFTVCSGPLGYAARPRAAEMALR